jgi:hypothetical protein
MLRRRRSACRLQITVGHSGRCVERVLAGVATVRNYIALAALLVASSFRARHRHKPSDHVD